MEKKTRSGFRDLTGQRFGKLTVVAPTDKRIDNGSVVWNCRCDCGNIAEVSARRLIRGRVKSCGCLAAPIVKDYIGRRFGRLTVIECSGKIRKNGSTVTYWKCRCDCGTETTVAQTELQNGVTQSCGCLQKDRAKEALHLIDGTSASILKNIHEKPPRKSNTSGYTGVYHAKDGRWMAYINFKKKRYNLGGYKTKEEAIKARKRGEEMHADFLEWYDSVYRKKDGKSSVTATTD